ncbi:hypothetical protein [Sphingomonas sp.]|nr:hypothetical protein [Sphingomonas sp.]
MIDLLNQAELMQLEIRPSAKNETLSGCHQYRSVQTPRKELSVVATC